MAPLRPMVSGAVRLLALAWVLFAAVAATAQPTHTAQDATGTIRRHHLQRLLNRMTMTPGALQAMCRYESEISTPPPARQVALTFDDGPEPGQTPAILEVLERQQVPGTFFMIGEKVRAHPQLLAQVQSAGRHTIGNHSWSHPNFHDIAQSQQAQEVLQFEALPGIGASGRLFRYPYGNASCETNTLLHERGYRIVGWHVDSCDWAFDQQGHVGPREALSCGVLAQNRGDFVEHVVSSVRAHGGGIVLLHEIHPHTLARLEELILRLKAEGFAFGSVADADFAPALR